MALTPHVRKPLLNVAVFVHATVSSNQKIDRQIGRLLKNALQLQMSGIFSTEGVDTRLV
jgi:hypothetical protein